MVQRVWPVDAVAGAPSYSGRALRQALMAPLLPGATAARPLGSTSGVRPGTPSTTVSVAALVWSVAPHAGILDLEAAVEAGPYGYAIDATVTGAVTAAHATLARWDGIYVQLSDPAESDGTATPGVAVVYVAGVAAASPALPATPARSMLLARITVPQSGGGSPSAMWLAPMIYNSAPAFASLAAGQLAIPYPTVGTTMLVGTGTAMREYTWNGTTWGATAGGLGGVVFQLPQVAYSATIFPLVGFTSTPLSSWGDTSWRTSPSDGSACFITAGMYHVWAQMSYARSGDADSLILSGYLRSTGGYLRPDVVGLGQPNTRLIGRINGTGIPYNPSTVLYLGASATTTAVSAYFGVERIGD